MGTHYSRVPTTYVFMENWRNLSFNYHQITPVSVPLLDTAMMGLKWSDNWSRDVQWRQCSAWESYMCKISFLWTNQSPLNSWRVCRKWATSLENLFMTYVNKSFASTKWYPPLCLFLLLRMFWHKKISMYMYLPDLINPPIISQDIEHKHNSKINQGS